MSSNRFKSFVKTTKATLKDGKECTVLVYGELSETKFLEGFAPILFTRKGRKFRTIAGDIIPVDKYRSPKKTFNMGWAICNEEDDFSLTRGIKWAKKRFAKSPMSTQNGNFLTIDMCNAIVDNECKYIAEHIDKFTNILKKK